MLLEGKPIQKKLMTVMLLTSGVVLLITCTAYFAYELTSFRRTLVDQLTIVGEVTAANTTAALAFDSPQDAYEILESLKADPHIVEAVLFDSNDSLFAHYPRFAPIPQLANFTRTEEFQFEGSHVTGTIPVVQNGRLLGHLYLKSDMEGLYSKLWLYTFIAIGVIILAFFTAYILSRALQKTISAPILKLGILAKLISDQKDYSMRATKQDTDEVGALTEAFNQMLEEIQMQNDEIISLNQNLELKVQERTAQLEKSYKEMEAFSYSVSHDLSAPLRHIHSFISLFINRNNGKIEGESRHLLDRVIANTEKMQQLIDDLLTFSRMSRKSLVKTPTSMGDIVTLVWREMKKQEQDRNITIALDELPQVNIDVATIKQVWINLISNALKFSQGTTNPTVTITCREEEDRFVFAIADNGVGFDEQYTEKLFQPFQRLHSQQEFEGTGIGLSIVSTIITKHGGTVWAESKTNQGATFYFSIPKDPEWQSY